MHQEASTDPRVITLAGEYDIARRPELAELLDSVTGGAPVTIDMSAVKYVDSTFLGELTKMRLRLAEVPVTLLGVHPNVARIMHIAKLDRFFTFR
jgi:anti-anti-sigma factor